MSDISQSFKIRYIETRITNTFDKDQFSFFVNGLAEILRIIALNKVGIDAQLRENNL